MAKTRKFEPRTSGELFAAFESNAEMTMFYDGIVMAWSSWQEYKFLQHKQAFATVGSECAAIKKLHYLAEGEPYLAECLIEYAMGELWEGFYMPKEPGLWAYWKKRMAGADTPKFVQPPIDEDLAFLVMNEGWPEAAFRSPSWFNEEAAEYHGDYASYISQTRTFFGDLTPGNHLTESEWRQYIGNKGVIGRYTDQVDSPALIAARSLRFHIDFSKSGYSDIRTFLGV